MKKTIVILSLLLSVLSFGESINIMSFNIRNSKNSTIAADGIHNWPARSNKLVSFLKISNSDIIGFQEDRGGQVLFLSDELPEYGRTGIGRDDGIHYGEHTSIFYKKDKFTVIDNGTFWLSETPEIVASISWDTSRVRIATWVRLQEKKTGKRILVFNTHFDHKGIVSREKSAQLIVKKAKKISHLNDEPILIMGDLNFERNNKNSYETFTNDYNDAKFSTQTPPKGFNYTYNGFGKDKKSEIDYIFVSDNIQVNSYEQLQIIEDGIYLSDHGPIIAKIKLLKN
ncbi:MULTISPECIES: endonuclease/exonuclease/phosphatase family protein [Psychrilyobacter]|uniref:Endonuclease/exonuclease/phosphatase domain-containing protein n=1 Tax=Psychrilyobacter piezotolerans TaxID=2293438 RepID=A0ABX9KJN1_9FUSO|nr:MULTISPECIES: endonuclease/exonuclease/phosphatase family protein [Psychrilyobacter]MCS5420613.1 endonuclease/exonuclease/phosphatase family protein [Psychrilyobacter sp. S5]NDI77368.1 endonuclease/exonuclease/phosphatase family protein [Psychrilyobacter piezotolerans]RDE63673.1 hypothetical protein DV867_04660 [Psychrilyobacter sp. S5]REI42017.1 hypothetical protein DYH56_04660 [Psychrilyobacter piezotolerans]